VQTELQGYGIVGKEAVGATGESRPYGNVILTKEVIA
jgi:hypothetical protein